MEYSLSTLNNKSNFSSLSLNETINKLNLVGFEVDEVSFEKTTSYAADIKFLLKSPANREDLFVENLFIAELGVIFLLDIYESWESLKQYYSFLLKQKYFTYKNYESKNIEGNCSELIKYVLRIDNFLNLSSPNWIQKKLVKRGVKPTNSFQDLIELVSLEWGYTFKIYSAKSENCNETFTTQQLLNSIKFEEKDILLPSGAIVLQDKFEKIKTVIGLDNDIKKLSNSIYLEATFYDIHKNPLDLSANNTKLSFSSLRKNYLSNFKFALQRLLSLIEILNIGNLSKTIHIFNTHSEKIKEYRILKLEKKLLRAVLNLEDIDGNFFNRSGLKVISETHQSFSIQIPSFRNDLTRQIDLVEEYSRFIGYANFPEILPTKQLKYSLNSQKNIEYIKTFLVNHNFNEIYTNPLQENNYEEQNLKLFNPLNGELSVLRNEILSNLIKILETNLNSNIENNNLFEIGRVFKLYKGKIVEQEKLAGLFQDPLTNGNDLEWFVKKGFLENFLTIFGYKNLIIEKWNNPNVEFHPTRTVIIKYNNNVLGFFGEINPKCKSFKQLKSTVYLFEFNLIHFKSWRLHSSIPIYKESSKYPTIQKDLSILISKNENFYYLKQVIQQNLTELKSVNFFDIYVDKKIINSNIKLGLRFEFQSLTETLTNEIIEDKIISLRKILTEQFKVIFQD